MNKSSLCNRALRAINEYSMFRDADSVLVALSGGSDSVALLHFLTYIKDRYGIRLYATHVNHMIRGDEALRDELFVKSLCESMDVELYVGHFDIPALSAEEKSGVEETARKYRYMFFSKLCEEKGISRIATAHTCSDSTETVFFNLVRGTGISGLKGISAVRDNIVRPLIYCTKKQIFDYCYKNRLAYITDSTNLCPDYTRNFLRLKILPQLGRINPSLDESVMRMSFLVTQDNACLERLTDEFIKVNNITDSVDIDTLLSQDAAIASRVILKMYSAVSGEQLGYIHVKDIFKLIRKKRTGSRVTLPHCYEILIEYERLLIKKSQSQDSQFSQILDIGNNYVDLIQKKVTLSVCTIDNMQKNVYNLFKSIVVDYDKIIGNITIRSRNNGDSYIFNGHTRTLKKAMIDQKIPRDKRVFIPVFADEAGIIAVEEMPVCDRVKINSSTSRVLEICIHETDLKMSENIVEKNIPDTIERILLSEEQIEAGVKKVARELEECFRGQKVLLVGILKGSVVFLSDLIRELDLDAEIAFMQASSYGASTQSSGSVNIKLDLEVRNLQDYHVVIVEDVIDTGFTMAYLSVHLRSKGAMSVSLCSLLDKPSRRRVPIKADFIGYEIPDEFVVGYGLDYNGLYRGLPFVGVLKREAYE